MKYEITDIVNPNNPKLKRIRALKDFLNVKKGDLGGFVESVANLSQDGTCWIYDNAHVSGNAQVCGNAKVYNNAIICGNAKVSGNTRVFGNAKVYGDAAVGNSMVGGDSKT